MASSSGSLPRYILVRLLLVIPMMWVLLTIVFFLLRVAPGDPVSAAVGGKLDAHALALRRAALGLDRPLVVQYLEYLRNVAQFDFGHTISDNRPVLDIIKDQGGATLTLTLGAFLVALLVGLPLGRLAGRRRDTAADAGIRIFGVVSYAAPIFWVGIMLVVLVVKVFPGWPTYDIASVVTKFTVPPRTHILLLDAILDGNGAALGDILKHHVLPCLTLGLLLSGVIIRLVRINVIQAMKGDYVEAARARGIAERHVVRRHAFRNALVPVITVIGLQIALTLSGAILTERTFNWPGLGTELVQYITARDYIAVQGLVTFFAVVVVLVSVVVDIINALVDPRVRY
ncbi:ABC transporter permease [Nocardioides panaciterrulae]|uniref:Peptide/nickel transport system permease protein n=1 Tax=Nocardioides panaciterrulae TaxID=661492 RepID=A0A7Y9E6N8_9ACTN|nr:ABC transporter permease [Nocardioides panaciterrulae]NYD41851.1 peptide/nickel transport system permease protein [Nocardioides panaciterrulae]